MRCPICKQNKNNISKFFKHTEYPICFDCLQEDNTLYERGTAYLEEQKAKKKCNQFSCTKCGGHLFSSKEGYVCEKCNEIY